MCRRNRATNGTLLSALWKRLLPLLSRLLLLLLLIYKAVVITVAVAVVVNVADTFSALQLTVTVNHAHTRKTLVPNSQPVLASQKSL